MDAVSEPLPVTSRRYFWWRFGLTLVLVAVVVVFYGLGWQRYFSWEQLRTRVAAIEQDVNQNRVQAALVFVVVYVTVTALSLPVSTWLSLLAGALFGRWLGTGIVSVSATIGATCAFLSSRFLFRDLVESRFRTRLIGLQSGLAQDGAFYVLFLRLVPLFPFFLVNLGLGVTRIPVRTYMALSWIGMLPANFLFVNAGAEIGRLEQPQDVLTWRIMLSLSALGIFPLVARWVYRAWRDNRTTHRRPAD